MGTGAARPDATTQLKSREFSPHCPYGQSWRGRFSGSSAARRIRENKRAVKCGPWNRSYAIGHDPWAIPAVAFEFSSQDYSRDT